MDSTRTFVVSHTHWDREWYMTYESFRMRLIQVFEELFELIECEEIQHFHFDGQTIIIEDILSICPKYNEKLSKLIKENKINIGPWYVLPDGFATGSESLIRNLSIGMNISGQYSVNFGQMKILGYLPDTFGYCSQMPQILSEFGIEYAIIWRGISGENVKTEFIWEGADKTAIKTVHLLDECGYLNLRFLSVNVDEAENEISEAVCLYKKYSTTGNVLLMNGYDHQSPQRHIGKVIKELKKRNIDIEQCKLSDYVVSTFDEIKKNNIQLSTYKGELNQVNNNPNARFNTVLKSCFSSRTDVKIKDFETERKLLRYGEPLMVMCMLRGGKYRGEFLYKSWKYLVQNHAHDSICGCSIGEVNDDMIKRYNWSQTISEQCAKEGMYHIVKNISIPNDTKEKIAVHIFNTLPFDTQRVIEFAFEIEYNTFFKDLEIYDCSEKKLQHQIIDISDNGKVDNIISKPIGWKKNRIIKVKTMTNIPSFGYTTLFVKVNNIPVLMKNDTISKKYGILENEKLYININSNGTIDIKDKHTKKELKNCNYFKDSIDIGDLYMYSPPHRDIMTTTVFSHPQICMLENGELSSTYLIKHIYAVPQNYDENTCKVVGESKICIETYVNLEKNSNIVKIRTKIKNTAKQHRIRAVFPTHCINDKIMVDSHFDAVKRNIKDEIPDIDAMIETPYNSASQKRFLIYGDLTLYNKGIQEYEVVSSDNENNVELTLLRCVEKIGQGKTLKTVVMPGPEFINSPQGQCLGEYEFEYGIGVDDKNPNEISEIYLNDVAYMQNDGGNGKLPLYDSLLNIDNTVVKVSAIKKSDFNDDTILRIYNPWEEEQSVNINMKCSCAEITDFREVQKEKLEVVNNKIPLCIKPKKIITLRLKK